MKFSYILDLSLVSAADNSIQNSGVDKSSNPIGGSAVAECLTQDLGAAGSSLTGFTVLCP